MEATPASTNERTTAGPAFCAATVPVSTKMPVPMMAPTPRAVRFTGPSARWRLLSVSASACRSVTLLRRNKFMGGQVWVIVLLGRVNELRVEGSQGNVRKLSGAGGGGMLECWSYGG